MDFYERCDDVWAVGSQTADVLHEYGYKGYIHVIPNGVTRREVDEETFKLVQARYELNEVQNVFLFVGQLNWKKNILRILEACALLKKQGCDFRLLLAGQGPDRDAIRRKIAELDLEADALLVGHITDIKTLDALYASATLFLFPSLYDNAPMVVREAASMGTPSILAEGSSASEIIRDGENGWLCRDDSEHRDPESHRRSRYAQGGIPKGQGDHPHPLDGHHRHGHRPVHGADPPGAEGRSEEKAHPHPVTIII